MTFRHKPHKRQCTSPGSLRPQQYFRPLTRSCKLSRSLPKHTLSHLAKGHKQWQKGLRLCKCSFKLSFSNLANPTTFQVQHVPKGNTSQGAPSWLPSNQPALGAPPWSQGPQFDFINTAPALTIRLQAPTPGFGANQAPNLAAMTWS